MPGPKAIPFHERYIPEPNSGCWLWETAVGSDGYGKISHRQRHWQAHRLSWVMHRGDIPSGMWVLHKCDTPSCVNPDHLFLGTPEDNSRDRDQKGRDYRPSNEKPHFNARLTDDDVRAIRLDRRSQYAIAKDYGIAQPTVNNIKRRTRWQHIS